MSLCFDLGSHQTGCFADFSSCLLQFPDCCLLLPSCLSKAIPLCICMCFCGCVNHASTQRSIQFLMGPPGLHSSSLLIFSCSPFRTPRGLDVSIGPAGAKESVSDKETDRRWGEEKSERRKMKGRTQTRRRRARRGLRSPRSLRPSLTPDLDHDLRGCTGGQRLCESATAAIHSTAGWWWSYAASPACLTWSVLHSACGSQGPHIHL